MVNKLRMGTVTPGRLYYGSTNIEKAYLGEELVFGPDAPVVPMCTIDDATSFLYNSAKDITVAGSTVRPYTMAVVGNFLYVGCAGAPTSANDFSTILRMERICLLYTSPSPRD